MSSHLVERVLVVPTAEFREVGYFQGFCHEPGRYLEALLGPEHGSYRPRHEVEEDPSFKQLIPYVVFQHRDANGRLSVFQYTRGSGLGEGRLHSKRSVGVGGHISIDDERPRDTKPMPRACVANWKKKCSSRPTTRFAAWA